MHDPLKWNRSKTLFIRQASLLEDFDPSPFLSAIRLNLSHLGLHRVPDWVAQLRKLRVLVLSHNDLVALPDWLHELAELQVLILGQNSLTELPASLGRLKQLRELHLSGNLFTQFPEPLLRLPSLRQLWLAKNYIDELPEALAWAMPQLKSLHLQSNPLRHPQMDVAAAGLDAIRAYFRSWTHGRANFHINFPRGQVERQRQLLRQKCQEWNLPEPMFLTHTEQLRQLAEGSQVLLVCGTIDDQNRPALEHWTRALAGSPSVLFHRGALGPHRPWVESLGQRAEYYHTVEELEAKLKKQLSPEKAKVVLESLELENIGHYKHLEVQLHPQLTCLVGLNGTGKTTLIRAIALALVGHDHQNIRLEQVEDLLRIEGLQENFIRREKGRITLRYRLQGQALSSTLLLLPEGIEDTQVVALNHFPVLSGHDTRSLLIGFTQNRSAQKPDRYLQENLERANVNDLAPLINNTGQAGLGKVSEWIIYLYKRALEQGPFGNGASREERVIRRSFEVFSEILGEKTVFQKVLFRKKRNQDQVWISTQYNPEGISLDLASQGFQSIIGWVGHFLQRLSEAYPDSDDFTREPAVCMVDEMDIFMHPRWQRGILEALCKVFSQTQFIISTHSPFIAQSAADAGIVLLRKTPEGVVAERDPVDIRGWRVDQILISHLFGLDSVRPVEVERLLKRKAELELDFARDPELKRQEAHDLDQRLDSLPMGQSPEDIEAMRLIREAALHLNRPKA